MIIGVQGNIFLLLNWTFFSRENGLDLENEKKASILVVEDDALSAKRLGEILEKQGYKVTKAFDGATAVSLLRSRAFEIVLTDLLIDEIDGFDILLTAKELSEDTEVIIITGYGSVDSAIEATKKGAYYYLQKPLRPDEVRHIVDEAVKKVKMSSRIKALESVLEKNSPYSKLIGSSESMLEVKKMISRIEESEANVLVTGESGTGKEIVARCIHDTGPKKNGKFVAFNCGSFNEELFANEIFGHEKDAFTGASGIKKGLLETADKGTVFLDEIGDIPLSMQAKLLRVIQEKELIRIGGTNPVPVDIRIIAATNRDLKSMCSEGSFRHDLYFRLNVIHIELPALHSRKEDIPILATHFLKKFCSLSGKKISGFSNDVMDLLTCYSFPGNVRELENIVEHAVSMARGRMIKIHCLPKSLRESENFSWDSSRSEIKTLEELENDYIKWVLEHVESRKTEASKILGINRASLYRKLKKSGLEES